MSRAEAEEVEHVDFHRHVMSASRSLARPAREIGEILGPAGSARAASERSRDVGLLLFCRGGEVVGGDDAEAPGQ